VNDTDHTIQISEKLQRVRELMPYALFLAWYAGTSFNDEVLEKQLDEKLQSLDGVKCLPCSGSGKKWTYQDGEPFIEDCPECRGTGRVKIKG